jgi:hypothetical protein
MTGTLTMLVVPVPVPGADSTLRAKAPILHLKVGQPSTPTTDSLSNHCSGAAFFLPEPELQKE